MAGSVFCPICQSVCLCVSHTFPNAPASPEEHEEKEIYCSSRGEGQFISDLCGAVFPRDQVTTVEEKDEDVEKSLSLTSPVKSDFHFLPLHTIPNTCRRRFARLSQNGER